MTELNNERGSALIVVLGLITLISLLTISLVTFSKVSDRTSKITCDRANLCYWSESALDRTMWLLRNDIVKHPTRSLGQQQSPEEAKEEIERFLADGTAHVIDNEEGGIIKVSIFDAVTGIDISGSNPTRYLLRDQTSFGDDQEKFENYKLFLNAITDYVDANDFIHMNGGFEKEDYDAIGMAPLPRNYNMEYNYEILWVPGFQDFFSVDKYGRIPDIRIIAPPGLRQLRGNTNFFSADKNQLQLSSGLTQEQIDQVITARDAWIKNQIPLSENIAPDVLSKLQQNFSFNESGFYTFMIEASFGQGMSSRIFTCTVQIINNLSAYNEIRYYEWCFLR